MVRGGPFRARQRLGAVSGDLCNLCNLWIVFSRRQSLRVFHRQTDHPIVSILIRRRRRLLASVGLLTILVAAHGAFIVLRFRPRVPRTFLQSWLDPGCCCGNWSCGGEDG